MNTKLLFLNHNLKIIIAFLALRFLSVFIIKTSFVPDEYWQSLEVSHKMTYGYGYLTWEWDKRIRTCAYPFIFHLIYKILPDSTIFIVYGPKFLQAALSAVADFFACKLAYKYFGGNAALWTALNISLSWFLFYCASRTITNMAEAALTTIGFYFYPWSLNNTYRSTSTYLWFAGVSAVVRPTAVVTWFPLYIWHLNRVRKKFLLIKHLAIIGFIIFGIMLIIDRWCYGQWVFAHYNFFLFNWRNDIGAFYGSHFFLWNFLIGLPFILGVHLIPLLFGLLHPKLKPFYCLIFWVLIVLSIPSHKEFRFLLPCLHLMQVISGVVMSEAYCKIKFRGLIKLLLIFIIVIHVPVIIYTGMFHQRGVIDVTLHLSNTVDQNSSVLFLMPCHSTPYYSYIHKNIKMKFLTCEPNFEDIENYLDEADIFYKSPHKWLSEHYGDKKSTFLPSHIVMYDTLYDTISSFLNNNGYFKCYSTFHSHFIEGRLGNYVYIFCNEK